MRLTIPTIIFLFLTTLTFAQPNIIFSDNFETGTLDPAFWTARPDLNGSDGIVEITNGSAAEGQFGVRMGKAQDTPGQFTRNALDLQLDLSGQGPVFLEFLINGSNDETHQGEDGILFSDDGGATFTFVYQFDPGSWCGYGLHPPIDVRKLAEQNGLTLSDQFVIRFQQYDDADFFGTGDEDGFLMDNIRVYDPLVEYAGLPFFDNFETGVIGNAWTWAAADETVLPAVGVVKPSNQRGVFANEGIEGSFGVIMGKLCDQPANFTANALDLHLNLAGEEEVILEFWIEDVGDETHIQDGIYFSDDGGASFVKVWDFDPEEWCNGYGQHPPLDVVFLASKNGLALTDQFIIRFQQYDDADFFGTGDEDGFRFDEVSVYNPRTQYASMPFSDDFETGQLSEFWSWSMADATALPATGTVKPTNRREVSAGQGLNGSFGVLMGKRCDQPANFTANALDLHVNLAGADQAVFDFNLRDLGDEGHIQDGIFLSVDGGNSFEKIYSFDFASLENSYTNLSLDIFALASSVGLTLSEKTIIRFQQYDDADFFGTGDEDGIYLDEISVNGTYNNTNCSTVTITLSETITSESCAGNDGGISLTASGGAAPYTYSWNTGASGATLNALPQGSYSVTVTDANGCTTNQSFAVGNNCSSGPCDNVTITLSTSITLESCSGNDGRISATASGGIAPYSYTWNTGETGSVLTGLTAGDYSVTVTDANGCTATQNISVGSGCSGGPCDNVTITLSETITPESCTGNDGGISLTTAGGAGPYTYSWNTGASGATLSGITQGSYTVTVTDANGCSSNQTFQVAEDCNTSNCPTAGFTVDNLGGGSYRFNNTSTNNPQAVFWQFGDGTESINYSPTHTYSAPGDYTVTLIVANACGVPGEQEDTIQQTITVSLSNEPLIQLGEAEGPSGETVLLPVIALNFNRTLGAIQGILNVQDPSVAQIEGLEGGLIGGFSTLSFNPANGRFSFFDAGNNNIQLDARDTLFYLRILLQGNNGDMSAVTISGDNGFPLEFGDIDFNLFTPATEDGKVTVVNNFRVDGLITTHWDAPIPGVSVSMEMSPPGGAPQSLSTTSDAGGGYGFDDVPAGSACVITPEKNTNAANGLAAIALFAGQRFILGYDVPQINSPFQLMAGDANCDGRFSTLDLFIIQKIQVGIDPVFPGCPSWVFVPASEEPNFQLASVYYPNYPYPRQADIAALSQDTQIDFIGVKVGDILNRADPNALQGQPEAEPRSGNTEPLLVRAEYLAERRQMRYELMAAGPRSLASYQFSLGYDTERLRFREIITGKRLGNAPLAGQQAGRLNLSWFSSSGRAVDLEGGDVVLTLYFDLQAPGKATASDLRLDGRGLPARMHDAQLQGAVIELQPLQTTSLDPAATYQQVRLYQNRPNPFREQTQIGFFLPEASEASLIVRDALGRVVWEKAARYPAGEQLENVDLPLAAGVYFYTLRTETSTLTKSMAISK